MGSSSWAHEVIDLVSDTDTEEDSPRYTFDKEEYPVPPSPEYGVPEESESSEPSSPSYGPYTPANSVTPLSLSGLHVHKTHFLSTEPKFDKRADPSPLQGVPVEVLANIGGFIAGSKDMLHYAEALQNTHSKVEVNKVQHRVTVNAINRGDQLATEYAQRLIDESQTVANANAIAQVHMQSSDSQLRTLSQAYETIKLAAKKGQEDHLADINDFQDAADRLKTNAHNERAMHRVTRRRLRSAERKCDDLEREIRYLKRSKKRSAPPSSAADYPWISTKKLKKN